MFKTTGEALKHHVESYLKRNGMSQGDFAKLLNVSRQTLSSMFRHGDIKEEYLIKAAEILGIDRKEFQVSNQAVLGIPVLDVEVNAGLITLFKNDIQENVIGTIDLPEFRGCDYILKVRGDSMNGRIDAGSWIAVKEIKSRTDILWGHVYLIVTEEFSSIKYLYATNTPDKWLMKSENKHYPEQEVKIKDVRHLFLVKSSLKINHFTF